MATRRRAGTTVNVEADFSKGMIRDVPRHAIPPGGVYDSTDFLLHEPGVAIKRGGTSYAGPALVDGSYSSGVFYAQFPSGAQLLGVSDTGHIYKITSGTTSDLGGVTASLVDRPALWVGGGKNLVIFPNSNGTTAPTKYDGSAAPALLGGSPPGGKYATVYKSRVALAASSANPNRIYFSPAPDIETTWDTANSWVDADNSVRGMAALRNALVIFSMDHSEVITGSSPPPGSDMDRYPLGSIGCTDARSIAVQEGLAIFANPRGVYTTNGASLESLTGPPKGGIESYWQSLFDGYNPDTWTISGGLYRRFYIVTILDNGGVLKDALMCNLPSATWWRLTNIKAAMWSSAFGSQEELYYADRSSHRVVTISGMFSPRVFLNSEFPSAATYPSSTTYPAPKTVDNRNDADGTAVSPFLETRTFGGGPTLKHFGFAHLTYDMRDAASDNPTLAVTTAAGIEATTYGAVSESPLGETADATRSRATLSKVSQGVSVRFQQTNASSKTELYELEYEERPLSPVEGGQ